MKMLRAAFFVALNLLVASPAIAQWQTPDHSIPIGNGAGVTGFNAAVPGTAGLPLASNGASADPSFQLLTAAGIANNALTNALFAQAPANTAKCNPTGGTANIQDCTGAQLISSLGIAPAVTTFTASHNIVPGDCNNIVQMGNGASGQLGLVIPASPLTNGFTGTCPITIVNGNLYSPGVSAGVILSGALPNNQFYILFPQQSFDLKISNGAFVATRAPVRWGQTGPQIFVAKSTAGGGLAPSDTTNDCLSLLTPCVTITHAMAILYSRVDNLNGAPTIFLNLGDSFSECVQAQGQLTGVNVGFIKGNGGNANWSTSGTGCGATPAAINIGDNAEWEIQNVTFFLNANGAFGIFIHQTGVVDVLTGVHFTGSATGTTALSSDHGGFLNLSSAGQMNITGTITTFLNLGGGTQSNLGIGMAFIGTVAMTDLITVNGAGAAVNTSFFSFTGTVPAGLVRDVCAGPNEIALGGQTLPGTAGSPTHGCQVF